MFPPIPAHPTWAAIPIVPLGLGPGAGICPLASILQSAALYRLAYDQSAETVQRAHLTRRILDSTSSFNSWN